MFFVGVFSRMMEINLGFSVLWQLFGALQGRQLADPLNKAMVRLQQRAVRMLLPHQKLHLVSLSLFPWDFFYRLCEFRKLAITTPVVYMQECFQNRRILLSLELSALLPLHWSCYPKRPFSLTRFVFPPDQLNLPPLRKCEMVSYLSAKTQIVHQSDTLMFRINTHTNCLEKIPWKWNAWRIPLLRNRYSLANMLFFSLSISKFYRNKTSARNDGWSVFDQTHNTWTIVVCIS